MSCHFFYYYSARFKVHSLFQSREYCFEILTTQGCGFLNLHVSYCSFCKSNCFSSIWIRGKMQRWVTHIPAWYQSAGFKIVDVFGTMWFNFVSIPDNIKKHVSHLQRFWELLWPIILLFYEIFCIMENLWWNSVQY